ncbi:D-inositol 3-phosphate glycosyltransferase [Pirellula sp. SH-Sr6A]|uniref:glycosyltransferase family 4 protein n=1 Tax=Pirellula sp. SH-Sr6A TaxID=1632865 RepID=UPI00078B6919|nr:glycosyltransferase family 1 protein [Pirellula sp. SH-Sr6A]AMV31839.1 D-inositol 3-phosphate glycosyltransferase [Pirellula sp. SH-Sr6A]
MTDTQPKPHVTLVLRCPRPGIHSIERLFRTLEPLISRDYHCEFLTLPKTRISLRNLIANIAHVYFHSTDVLHITGDAHYLAIPTRKKTILTIHDCERLRSFKGIKRAIYKLVWFKLPCIFARRITVISESTRKELEKEVGQLGEKLVVIENCVTLSTAPTNREFDSITPSILQIGSARLKNLDGLIKAVRGLKCKLHIVGAISDSNLKLLNEYGVLFKNESDVSDERMRAIYHENDILFFASHSEGFGLPILEAQSCGVPVITSSKSSMPEVAGGAAILVNPEDPLEIRAAITKLITDHESRRAMVEKGFLNIRRFQPEIIAAKYCDLYREMLETR